MVTISASYGAGGSVIGPAVARLLGVPFFDRALPVSDAVGLGGTPLPPGETAGEEERTEGLITRLLSRFAASPDPLTSGLAAEPAPTRDAALQRQAEARVRDFARADGVILGWGSTLVVGWAFHVRLDGPVDARVRRGMELERLDEDAVRSRLADTDRVRSLYIRRIYGRDWRDPALYHLVLDTTAIDLDTGAGLVATAAHSFWSGVH